VPRLSSNRGLRYGYRSGLEKDVAEQITDAGFEVLYEDPSARICYSRPATLHTYTPDFALPNGIIIETKGRFTVEDRAKHLLIKEQCPGIDIRFVFSRSKSPLYKGSPTTYAKWCEKHGFRYADRLIPTSWLKEKRK
jgi:hypothetical protein